MPVARALAWVDDESNASTRHARNAIRHSVMPALATVAGNAGATLARAAGLQAEAAKLADDLAAIDARDAFDGATLSQAALRALPDHRARNLLRWFLHAAGLTAPSAARLAAMHAQLARCARRRGDAARCTPARRSASYRGRVCVHAPAPQHFDVAWDGMEDVELPHGCLRIAACEGDGIDAQRIRGAALVVRSRLGGERMQARGEPSATCAQVDPAGRRRAAVATARRCRS